MNLNISCGFLKCIPQVSTIKLCQASYEKSMTKSYMNVKTKQNCFLPEIKEMARRFILASAVTQEKKLQAHRLERASLVAQMVKNLPVMQETRVQSVGWGRSPGGKNGNPLQYSGLENSTDRGAWQATVAHGVTNSWKRWSDQHFHSGFPGSSAGKESSCNPGDPGSIPGLGRSAGEGIGYPLQHSWASLVAQLVKNPPAMWQTWVQSLGWEDLLKRGTATHSSILAWRILWTVYSSWGR